MLNLNLNDAVFAIGIEPQKDAEAQESSWAATGFFYSYKVPNEPRYWTYLVTARHVIEDEKEKGQCLAIKLNTSGNKALSPITRLDISKAIFHPKDKDVAVMQVDIADEIWNRGVEAKSFPSASNSALRSQMTRDGYCEGHPVIALGFPLGLTGKTRKHVTARFGIIASIQEFFGGESEEYLIDSNLFPGNSGSPVVSITTPVNSQVVTHHNQTLIGMVTHVYKHRQYITNPLDKQEYFFEEYAGLASVQPVDAIHETIEEHRRLVANDPALARHHQEGYLSP